MGPMDGIVHRYACAHLSMSHFHVIVLMGRATVNQVTREALAMKVKTIPYKCYLQHMLYLTCHATECPGGSYGQNCSEECECRNGASCDPITGECTCTSGWLGERCDRSKYNVYHFFRLAIDSMEYTLSEGPRSLVG